MHNIHEPIITQIKSIFKKINSSIYKLAWGGGWNLTTSEK